MIVKRAILLPVLLGIYLFLLTHTFAATESATTTQMQEKALEKTATIRKNVAQKKQTIRENQAAYKKEMRQKREQFLAKLQTLKDERKKIILDRIDDKISTKNTNITNRWNTVLDNLASIVNRIGDKAKKAKANGQDTTQVDTAVTTALSLISAAQTAVDAQAANEYVITIDSETTLGLAASSAMTLFHQDLRSTHTAVKSAREGVRTAAKELAKLAPIGTTATDSAVVQ